MGRNYCLVNVLDPSKLRSKNLVVKRQSNEMAQKINQRITFLLKDKALSKALGQRTKVVIKG